jgi:hypothetical protein
METECGIGSASILVGRGKYLIPEDVFDCYFHHRDSLTKHRLVTFRKYRTDCQGEPEKIREVTFDPDRQMVHMKYNTYLEYYSPDSHNPFFPEEWEELEDLAYCHSPEGRYRDFDPLKFTPETKVTSFDLNTAPDDEDMVRTVHQLRETGISGFKLEFKNKTKRSIDTDQLHGYVIRPLLKQLVFFWWDQTGKIRGHKYSTSRSHIKKFTTFKGNNSL